MGATASTASTSPTDLRLRWFKEGRVRFFPYWVVVTHFLNIFFMLLLARSGLEILSAFPKWRTALR
jgi:hypothetical protein